MITTFTGLFLQVLRFFNKLLGFIFGFTGLWLSLLLWLTLELGTRRSLVGMGSPFGMASGWYAWEQFVLVLPMLVLFPINCARYYHKNKDFLIFRALRNLFDPTYDVTLSGDRIPKAYLHSIPTGFFMGKKFGKYACVETKDIVSHILLVGGSRSGKSTGIILPNILHSWRHSFVAIDIKGELYAQSKHIHPDALVLDPFNDEESIGFDPFELLRLDEDEAIINARQLALALLPLPEDTRDKYWIKSARNILTAGIIHYFIEGYTFNDTMEILLEVEPKLLRKKLSESPHAEVRKYINQIRGMEDKTVSGVYSELSDRCIIFGVDKKIMRLMTKTPRLDMSIYSDPNATPPKLFVRIPANKIEYYSNFINLFFTFLITALDMRPERQGQKIMVFFDEAAQFGYLNKLSSALDTIAGKNVILLICMQALSQFYQNYGEYSTKTMLNNCDTRIILKVIDPDTQSYFSRMIGTIEIKRQSQSTNYNVDTGLESGRGITNNIVEVPIVKPATMAYLAHKREIIVLSEMSGYCKVRQVRYYEKEEFGYYADDDSEEYEEELIEGSRGPIIDIKPLLDKLRNAFKKNCILAAEMLKKRQAKRNLQNLQPEVQPQPTAKPTAHAVQQASPPQQQPQPQPQRALPLRLKPATPLKLLPEPIRTEKPLSDPAVLWASQGQSIAA